MCVKFIRLNPHGRPHPIITRHIIFTILFNYFKIYCNNLGVSHVYIDRNKKHCILTIQPFSCIFEVEVNKMRLQKLDDHIKEKLKDPYFKELYELEEQKLKIVKPIVEYRIKNKLSQKQLAERAGITQQHISKIENGEFSSISTLEKVLLFIGYTVKMQAIPLGQGIKHRLERLIHSKRRVQFA